MAGTVTIPAGSSGGGPDGESRTVGGLADGR